jgi:hypothetical protein
MELKLQQIKFEEETSKKTIKERNEDSLTRRVTKFILRLYFVVSLFLFII